MPSAADEVRDAIAAAGGALRFDHFVAEALYGRHGFYTGGGGRAGRRGDFITSPEVGPLFGLLVARAVDGWWRAAGRPEGFTFVELGAGPGTLARSVLAASPEFLGSGRYLAVEISEAQRALHPGDVDSRSSIDDLGPFDGVVFANELLDNLPFRLFVFDGGWREAHVIDAGQGRFAEILYDIETPTPVWLPPTAPHGARVPVQTAAAEMLTKVRSLLTHGRLVVVDYCSPATGLLAQRPWRDWLRTYRGHQRGGHYLSAVGEQDVTVEVAIDQLVAALGEPDAVRSQAQFLALWGIEELAEEGRRAWEAAAARPDLAAMRMRSRVNESAALTDPTGLGSFTVLEWSVDSREQDVPAGA